MRPRPAIGWKVEAEQNHLRAFLLAPGRISQARVSRAAAPSPIAARIAWHVSCCLAPIVKGSLCLDATAPSTTEEPEHPPIVRLCPQPSEPEPAQAETGDSCLWSFLSKKSLVLVFLAQAPEIRIRELAAKVGLSSRTVLRVIAELESAGYVTCRRSRRGSSYEVDREATLQGPLLGRLRVADLCRFLGVEPK